MMTGFINLAGFTNHENCEFMNVIDLQPRICIKINKHETNKVIQQNGKERI
jgi:hypothetical protein